MEAQRTQPIVENLWWAIPEKLAGVRMPVAAELAELQTAGIGAIVSVFHEDSNLDLYQQTGILYLWLPIAVDSAPSSEQLQEFQRFIQHQNELNRAVAVHCSTGKHRTGTMLAAYLMSAGWTYQEAMQAILAASSQVGLPENQTAFLENLQPSVE